MAPRKKNTSPDAPMLPVKPAKPALAAPVAPPPAEVLPPKFLEYTPQTELDGWQVERFDLLAVEFQFQAKEDWAAQMRVFHGFAEEDAQRWFYVRRLFGVRPVIPAPDAHPDDLRCFERPELCEMLGLKPDQLAQEFTHLRVAWQSWLTELQRSLPDGRQETPAAVPKEELALGDALLERFDFDKSLFEVEIYDNKAVGDEPKYRPRSREKNRHEMDWFVAKLTRPEWQKMLEEPMAGSLARTALVNELYLRRFDNEMMQLMPNTPKWKEMSSSRQAIESRYQEQLQMLQEKFPELGVAGRVSFRAVVSDMCLAHRQYYGKRDRRLWDKIHTAAEIVFLTRTSAQLPVPRYRLGWQVAVVEAMHGLYDPNFRSQLKRGDLKKLDAGFRMGVEQAKRELGEKDISLDSGVIPGEPDCEEFPDYVLTDSPGGRPPDKNI